MSFAHPTWLGGLWLALVVLGLAAYAQRRRQRVLEHYAAAPTRPRILRGVTPARRWLAAGLLALCTATAVVALAGPRYGYRWQTSERRGVDLLVAVDCSRSMLATDVEPSRLGRAKREVLDLLRRLEGDRIGLVAFAGTAFLQCPLTLDYAGLNLFLRALEPDYLPLGGTALADAIHTGMDSFDPESAADKALILITDGEATSGEAEDAAVAAQKAGVHLYIMGVGTPEGAPVPAKDGGFIKDRNGGIVIARLGEEALQKLAARTGGTYVRSVAGDEDLDAVYGRIRSDLEAKTLESRKVKVWEERFQWPLAVAALSLLAALAVPMGAGTVRLLLLAGLLGGVAVVGASPAQAAGTGAAVRSGIERYQAGDYKGAAEAFTRAQVADPTAPQLAYNLGSAQYRTGAFEDALGSFSMALRGAPPELKGQILYNRGNAAFRLGRLEDALADYRAALEADPRLDDARLNLAYTGKLLAQRQAQQQQRDQDDRKESGEKQDGKQASDEQGGGQPQQEPSAGQQAGDPGAGEPQTGDKADQQRDAEKAEAQTPSSLASSAQEPKSADQLGKAGDGSSAAAGEATDEPTSQEGEAAAASAGRGERGEPGDAVAAQRARALLNRLKDQPGRALMPRYRERRVEQDW